MTGINRLQGGMIDRNSPVSFTFDGRLYNGFKGDTLASALLANEVKLLGRSFKYHRPRGVIASGSEEPNALMELRNGQRKEPNTKATVIELFDGLSANSQNRWPSLACDFMAVNDRLSRFLTAGFYYKTFMWPKAFWEKVYEPLIRRAAGLGSAATDPDPDVYDKGFLHCDLLVVGSGPSGLIAALTAARAGARVILAEEDFELGGRLLCEDILLGDETALEWRAKILAELKSMDAVRILTRTSVFGAFDHGIYGALERVTDHLSEPDDAMPRQILWRIYSRRMLLCAGATERPIAFENNDRPGIMLAGAMRAYAHRWAVAADRDVTIFTNNDEGHKTARDLLAKGVNVQVVIDVRPQAPRLGDYELLSGAKVINTSGRLALKDITVRLADGDLRTVACGALGVSGGWTPTLSLTGHQRARPVWNDDVSAFVPPGSLPQGMRVAGAANGTFSLFEGLKEGVRKSIEALAEIGISASSPDIPRADDSPITAEPFWYTGEGAGRAWVDFQNDVTVKDIELAHQEGFRSVEHLKRYTTLGMATDQGKTANLSGLAILAELTGRSVSQTGTTIYRPPHTPVSIGALAGRSRDSAYRPTRYTPSHDWAVEQGAVFVEAGAWMRAQWFPRKGETSWRQSVDREVLAVRKSVGVCDVTTLGKIDVQGKDAADFLNTVYCNGFSKLPVGKARYGLMLREDGMVMDDGTVARLADDHFVVTTTTANASGVYRHMEFVHQCLLPELDVQLISITDAWAQFTVAGPNARKLLQKIVDPPFDMTNEAFPFMACAALTVCGGIRARLFRISFSGELSYEIAIPAHYGDSLIRVLMDAGREFDVSPYGTEALGVLRIEKGHPAGNELNGQISAIHLGLGRMISTKKDSIGAVLSRREGISAVDGLRLVGLEALDPEADLSAGAHLFSEGARQVATNDEGWVTSACYSPHLKRSIALAFLKGGAERHGEQIELANPIERTALRAKVVSPHFVDPQGDRLRV